ncbi:MAG: hypothetical protein K1X86_00100 [Ignavibacteria bacterium]|nr:hypothetical protein [Ignavibacteria bacterium]
MTKELPQDFDLTGLSDDEMYYKGEKFVEKLSELLAENQIYFGKSYEFKLIDQCYRELRRKLIAEERIVV